MNKKVLTKLVVKDLTGPKGLIVFFYPRAGSSGCSLQVAGFNRKLGEFQSLGYNIVGVSADSVEQNEAFSQEASLDYPLISDLKHELIQEYNVWGVRDEATKREGILRTTFVLDPNGQILFTHERVSDINPVKDMNALLKELSA